MNYPSGRHSAPLNPLPSSLAGGHWGVICLFPRDAGYIGFSAAKNMQLKIQGEPDTLIFNLDKDEGENSIQGLLLGAVGGGRCKVLFKIIKHMFNSLKFLTSLMDSY